MWAYVFRNKYHALSCMFQKEMPMTTFVRDYKQERYAMRTVGSCTACKYNGFQHALERANECDSCVGILIDQPKSFPLWQKVEDSTPAEKKIHADNCCRNHQRGKKKYERWCFTCRGPVAGCCP